LGSGAIVRTEGAFAEPRYVAASGAVVIGCAGTAHFELSLSIEFSNRNFRLAVESASFPITAVVETLCRELALLIAIAQATDCRSIFARQHGVGSAQVM
jgi:hypothetical protein